MLAQTARAIVAEAAFAGAGRAIEERTGASRGIPRRGGVRPRFAHFLWRALLVGRAAASQWLARARLTVTGRQRPAISIAGTRGLHAASRSDIASFVAVAFLVAATVVAPIKTLTLVTEEAVSTFEIEGKTGLSFRARAVRAASLAGAAVFIEAATGAVFTQRRRGVAALTAAAILVAAATRKNLRKTGTESFVAQEEGQAAAVVVVAAPREKTTLVLT